MFDAVARRYDLMNDLMTGFQVRRWRRLTHEAIDAAPGDLVLDLAGGTGASAVKLAERGVRVLVGDLSTGMLQEGRRRYPHLAFAATDALALPFADDTFDAVTISYGIRNVQDTSAALTEMARVTRPGGVMVICEFSTPTWRPFRKSYSKFVEYVLPALAKAFSSAPDAYVYLGESIAHWPDQITLARMIRAAGWDQVAYRNLMGGVVALHRAYKPLAPTATPTPGGASA